MPKNKKKNMHKIFDAEGHEIKKATREKFRCATTGKYVCEECGEAIERGTVIRFAHVQYADDTEELYPFCCKEHRNDYCDRMGIPF